MTLVCANKGMVTSLLIFTCFTDLLQMRENPTEKKDAVGYPRNEWFYLHDNELEEAEKKKETEE